MIHITCNTGSRDLPDMYALGPAALRLWAYIIGKSFLSMLQLILVWGITTIYTQFLTLIYPRTGVELIVIGLDAKFKTKLCCCKKSSPRITGVVNLKTDDLLLRNWSLLMGALTHPTIGSGSPDA